MGDLPLDAQRVVEELRAARQANGVNPRGWLPSESFESTLTEVMRPPIHTNEHLGWMHENSNIASLFEPPAGRGTKRLLKLMRYRLMMALFGPYFSRVQDYLGVNVRALDMASRRIDDLATSQLRLVGALRHDLIDFAHYVDERLGE